MSKQGVYAITNTVTGEQYIGMSTELQWRWQLHLGSLRHGKHQNKRLQAAWNTYGEVAFRFILLQEVPLRSWSSIEEMCKQFSEDRHTLEYLEALWYLRLRPAYNICRPHAHLWERIWQEHKEEFVGSAA